MNAIARWILSIFVGSIIGFFFILSTGEALFFLFTCGAIAIFAAILTYAIFSNSSLKGLLSVSTAIGAFILYFYLMDFVNESCESDFLCILIFLIPYVLLVFALATAHENKINANNQDEQASQ